MNHRIFTVGHSTRTIQEFAELLRAAGADFVVDVRTMPRSRSNPQFNIEALVDSLARFQIGYEHVQELGGLRGRQSTGPSPNEGWSNKSFRNYADYALTEDFAAGLARLRSLAERHTPAVICAEAVWWRCHRRIIADYLLAEGNEVIHILSETSMPVAQLTPFAQSADEGRLEYPPADVA